MALITHPSRSDRAVNGIIYVVLALFGLFTLFPVYYVFIVSITPYDVILRSGGFVLWPSETTLEAYRTVLSSKIVPQSLKITATVTIIGTALNLVATTMLAYPLSKKNLPGRNFALMAIVFTMMFSGGLIPLYLVVKALGLTNTIWSLIIPGLISSFYLLIMKTFFENLPQELEEAAKMDGCGDISTLYRILLPLCLPVIATLGLFYGIHHWNTYFAGVMYLQDRELFPIQIVLRNMIQTTNVTHELQAASMEELPPETVKMATVVIALIPVLVAYPFLQKYFMKGMLIGAIKG